MTTYAKHYIILLSAVTILLTGCTRLSKLESHGGSSVKETGIDFKLSKQTNNKLNKGKHSNKHKDTDVGTDVGTDVSTDVDTPVDNDVTDANADAPANEDTTQNDTTLQSNSNDVKGFDPSSGLYGPGT